MCGIVGCILKRENNIGEVLYQCLKRLEYRGYDSAGVAIISDGEIVVVKDKGVIDEINEKYKFDSLLGRIGIGHTRWATHGAPDKVNAHPHVDCKEKIAVVHNGVIENFYELKSELVDEGHNYKSRTDTEVICHLIEKYYDETGNFREAVIKAIRRLNGSFALAIISTYEPGKIYCVKKDSPLVLGISDRYVLCSSDIPSILPLTRRIVVLDDYDLAIISESGYEVYNLVKNDYVKRDVVEVDWSIEVAEKSGFPHFMIKEIHEIPLIIKYALEAPKMYIDLLAELIDRGSKIYFIAAGTSYHAALIGSYIFSKIARISVTPVIASEFKERYGDSIDVNSVVLAISQSGETADVLKAIEHAKIMGATILAITNVLGSTLTRVSRAYVLQQSGPEISVAATKTYIGQLVILYQLALQLARKRGKISQREIDELRQELHRLPEVARDVLERCENVIKNMVSKYVNSNLFFFLGRGINTATALEGRLKLMEISYIPSLAYPAGESKHGPISLIDKGTPVIFIVPRDETRDLIIGNIMEMKARGAKIIAIAEEGDKEISELSDDIIWMPKVNPLLTPVIYVIPLQLFAYYMAVNRGLDPDKPRHLAKSVTVL